MMPLNQPLPVNFFDWPKILANAPLLTSYESDWSSVQLACFRQSSIDIPEVSNQEHMVIIPLRDQAFDSEYVFEGCSEAVAYREKDFAHGCIDFLPANLPHKFRADAVVRTIDWIHCYIKPAFLAQIAHESIDPDHVELFFALKKPDLLIQQIGIALRLTLEVEGSGDRFYVDSLSTALAAHLLRYYSTKNHSFREYENGLSKQKLKRVIEYIQEHLGEDISLFDIATELEMSQYYFCRLFKQTMGMSPHQYLIRQRVEQAKLLLKQPSKTITVIALECGFANQSHFARCFRHHTGMNPNQFRKS
jgi:AraC family transcriptional regulator